MTIYCYDTEFLEDGKTIDLISIGIVAADGREYYAINSEADWDRIRKNDWLMDNVVRHLPTHRPPEKRDGFGELGWHWGGVDRHDIRVKPKRVIANEVREFLLHGYVPAGTEGATDDTTPIGEEPELWAYYAAYDHVALAQLWGPMMCLPAGIPKYTHDLRQELHRLHIPASSVALPKQSNEHDALADARWNLGVLRYLAGLQ